MPSDSVISKLFLQRLQSKCKRSFFAFRVYDPMADAIFWTDELPSKEGIEHTYFQYVFQSLIRYRTTLIMEEPDRELERFWIEAKSLAPNWIGFSPARCNPSNRLKKFFKKHHENMLLEIGELEAELFSDAGDD